MEETKKHKIGELSISNASQYSLSEKWNVIRYLDTGSITNNQIDNLQIINIGRDELPSRARRKVKPRDIIYSTVRPNQKHFGFIDIPVENMLVSTGFTVLSVNERLADSKYIYYWLSQQRIIDYLHAVGEQAVSAYPSIKAKDIEDLEIDLPTLSEQKVISSLLTSIDSKIELNRQINDNLEQQAQALFKAWFVDFEPFKNGKFVDSELGMIPECFELSTIGELNHKIESGKRPKGGATINGVPSIGAESVKGLGNFDYSKTKFIPKEFASCLKKGKVNGYELLIYKDGGKPGYFMPNFTIFGDGFPYEKMFINEHVFMLDFENRGFNCFAYFYMQTPYIMNQLNSIGGKAAIPGINTGDVESLPIFTPNNAKISEFGENVLPMVKVILQNCKENAKLTEYRDKILPKLMSGELKINDLNS